MDSGATLPPTITPSTAPTGQPLVMNTVVVFGDSLCDIGKKWTTKSGRMARVTNQMYVSPTGRFSDCRNWSDFMYEAATGRTLVVGTAEDTYAKSQKHFSFSANCVAPAHQQNFCYANYAEGGACGDTPASKADFLGTFKDQVDAFEVDCKASQLALGNTLFIVWFGANDLYTAECTAEHMFQVATQVASTQRQRLAAFVKSWNQTTMGADGTCRFIFVDLCKPLTSARYSRRLRDAEDEVKRKLGMAYMPPRRPKWGSVPQEGTYQARDTLRQAVQWGHNPGKTWMGRLNEVALLRDQVEEIQKLERGVLLFNSNLAKLANIYGDRVAALGRCVSEETIRKLIQGNNRLKAGAMGSATTTHVSANQYNIRQSTEHVLTVDEVHPTDQMYRLLWLEIYEQIKRSNCTFGNLTPVVADTPLESLSVAPTQQAMQDYGAVMNQIGASPQTRLRRTGRSLL
jgi:phospholipase/lecithinase/hemolysin